MIYLRPWKINGTYKLHCSRYTLENDSTTEDSFWYCSVGPRSGGDLNKHLFIINISNHKTFVEFMMFGGHYESEDKYSSQEQCMVACDKYILENISYVKFLSEDECEKLSNLL